MSLDKFRAVSLKDKLREQEAQEIVGAIPEKKTATKATKGRKIKSKKTK